MKIRFTLKSILRISSVLFGLSSTNQLFSNQDGWVELIDGKDLSNWENIVGTAPFTLEEDGVLVGRSKLEPAHSFLATREIYGDFILELEFMSDPWLNSGIQIRCPRGELSREPFGGYHVDIDPSGTNGSGAFWIQTERGWIQRYPTSANPALANSHQKGEWNHLRIEAIGNQMRAWVNRKMVSDIAEDRSERGVIGLQVHRIRSESNAGLSSRWRNIRIKTENLEAASWPIDPKVRQISYLKNRLSKREKGLGYRLLWDGSSFDGWSDVRTETISEIDWTITDGELQVNPVKNPGRDGPWGGLITDGLYENFELEIDFKVANGANSGVKYFVDPKLVEKQKIGMGPEYQILDDKNSEYASMGTNGNRRLASLVDVIAPRPFHQANKTATELFYGPGTWNKLRIVSRDGLVEHWLNNEQVIEYNRFTQLFEAAVARSMNEKWPQFGQIAKGHILLQDFDVDVRFRSIKIREI